MQSLVVVVGRADAELAADALWSLGVVAIEDRLGADDAVELWTSLGDDLTTIDRALTEALAHVGACTWRFVEVDDAVADTWRDHAVPTWVEPDLVVVPAWRPNDLASADVTVVSIEPGATFGAGDHPTTVLSLRAIRRLLRERASRRATTSVLDVGCGSGILSVGAAVLGATSVVGIDISPAAVPVTTANAERNGVRSIVTASTAPLRDVVGPFGVVVANILAPALVDLADDLIRVLADDGALVISGVLDGHFDHVVAALSTLRVQRVDQLGGWAAITLGRQH